ncbi:ATP synthase subunit s, mitochondrial-like [Daktulosphaira vitifoliae]|uniref:ATP synthase subunit s, mitochondrial-like n=1 Tax=Daktulosphaira vitifoliae TaxID=58002 RepID=UPI0021A99421|nr:ATP synthase subunit s, mitochondrial-like [Daktulosphaira vitifoliae]
MFKSARRELLKRVLPFHNRNMWQWVDDSFNRVDADRIKEMGSNMACAEWLMKNGAQVRWKDSKNFIKHYDCLVKLSSGPTTQLKIDEVYAGKEASISHLGFDYFKNCKDISTVSFIGCNSVENEAIKKLIILKDCLEYLKIIGCVNVTDSGILSLEQLYRLKYLELKNLQFFTDRKVIDLLKTALPTCQIIND